MKHEIKNINSKQKTKTLIAMCFVVIGVASAAFGIAPSFVCAQTAPATCPNFGLERTTVYSLQEAAYAYGYAVATDDANNTYVTGEQYAPATGLDMYVIKYDSNGNVAWSADVYDVITDDISGNESGYGIVVDPGLLPNPSDDRVYVVGRQQDGNSLNSKILIRKYNAENGTVDTTFGTNGTVVSTIGIIARAVALDSVGNLYIAAHRQKAAGGIEAILLSYDASGTLRAGFPVAYTAPFNSSAFSIAVSGGDIYMTGYTQPTTSNTDMFVQKYTIVGSPVWTQTYSSGGNQTDIGYGVTVDGSGNIFVTGYHDMNGGDSFFRKYDATGTLVWGDSYNSGSNQNDVGRGVIVGNSGRIFVAGRQQTNNEDAFLNEYYTEKNIPILPAANPPPGTEDWTTTQSVHCTDSQSPPEAWEPDTPVTLTPCDTGSHAYMNLPLESCTATSFGKECWYDSWGNLDCQWPTLSTTCYATLVESGFFASLASAYIYKGDQTGSPEYGEMAFGVAVTPSSNSLYTSTANDVYVVGYQASNGGEAFLNKYSCNAGGSVSTGASMIAGFTRTPSIGVAPLTVSVDARASAGSIINYQWDWNYNGIPAEFNASSDTGSLASHIYDTAGTYTIGLRVTSTGGAQDIASAEVTVNSNSPPSADFKVCDLSDANCVPPAPTPFTGVAPLRVNVDGATSTDPNAAQGGYIASFSWDWGDGTVPGVGEKATHQYFVPGLYTITLTVTDNGGLTNTIVAERDVSVIEQYVCTTGSGPDGSCAVPTPVCGPSETIGDTQCYECRADKNCGAGYECLGAPCAAGTQCAGGVECPADGRCPEVVACTSGATCPDGSFCPADGFCPATKNVCALSGSAVDTQCYVEQQEGGCTVNSDCTESITGGICDGGACKYARCSNETGLACATDNNCADGDGICNGGACVYIYDCAYGPGMGGGVTGQYVTSTPDVMPLMPLGVQPDGQACTQPTPDAPNNCEGINGCLYYNYFSGGKCNTTTGQCVNNPAFSCTIDKNCGGIPTPNSNNSVANCVNTFEGGTGCAYYQYYSPLATATTPTTKTNCLPRYAERSKKSPQAGIPDGCFVVDKGTRGKEYNCTAIDGCYYYLDGRVDCTYVNATAETCATATDCVSQLLAIGVCNASNLCEYQGNGCLYEPNPKGAIACPGATSPATGGDNFVQCMLNPDSVLPGFLNTTNNALSSCSVNANCPPDNICLNGTCYPQCQIVDGENINCASGQQCLPVCETSLDCAAGLICDGNVCVPPQCANATPKGTLWNVTTATLGLTTPTDSNCRYSTDSTDGYADMTSSFDTTNTTSHSEPLSGLTDGSYAYYVLCQELSSSSIASMCQIDFDITALTCIEGTICPNGAVCPADGVCPATVPACAGAFPTGSLDFGTTSTTIGLTTAQDAACSYSLVAIDPYALMTPFGITDATSHSTIATGLLTGPNTYYAKCQDASGVTSNACAIAFTVGTVCTDSSMCPTGFACIAGICQPPVCDNAAPTGALASDTSSVTISMTTDADADCKYSANSGDPYDAMTPFATTGFMSHASFVTGLVTGGNTQYVRCQDAVTSAEKFCSIPFSVGVCSKEFKCGTGFMCIPNTGIGICAPVVTCTPGTICPDGITCPQDGVCPVNPCWIDGTCPAYCPYGTAYNATSGLCENCLDNPMLPECNTVLAFCELNPTDPLCVGGPITIGDPFCALHPADPACINSCNTLGYTFTGSAVLPSGNCDLVAIILALLSWMAWLIALLAVLSGLRAAYLYITAMGNENNLILAKRYLVYTTIGVGVSVLSFSIVAIARAIMNI